MITLGNNADNYGSKATLYCQLPAKLHELDNGEYLLVTEQKFFQTFTNFSAWVRNNALCIGLSDKLESQYQYMVRQTPKKSTFMCCDPMASYVADGKVYIFHRGTDDKLKNTPDEFDAFCTSWEHGKTKPTTIEIARPDTDFEMYFWRTRELAENKLLVSVRGKGGMMNTTLQISN
jgi:hypothetical protein